MSTPVIELTDKITSIDLIHMRILALEAAFRSFAPYQMREIFIVQKELASAYHTLNKLHSTNQFQKMHAS
jgi:hypothetical protein